MIFCEEAKEEVRTEFNWLERMVVHWRMRAKSVFSNAGQTVAKTSVSGRAELGEHARLFAPLQQELVMGMLCKILNNNS